MKRYRASTRAWLFLVIVEAFTSALEAWAQAENIDLPAMSGKVYKKVAPVTVKIFYAQGSKNGTGVIIGSTEQGRALILTACHVVAANFEEADPDIPLEFHQDIVIKTSADIKYMRARVLLNYVDRTNDLALLASNSPVSIDRAVRYNRTDNVNPGETVAAFGFPGTDKLVQTVGHITRLEDKYLVFDSKITPGNSGGPLIDKHGRMIGVCIFIRGGKEGYAINMNLVSSVVDNWLKGVRLKETLEYEEHPTALGKTISKWPLFVGGFAIAGGGILAYRSVLNDRVTESLKDFPTPPGRPGGN